MDNKRPLWKQVVSIAITTVVGYKLDRVVDAVSSKLDLSDLQKLGVRIGTNMVTGIIVPEVADKGIDLCEKQVLKLKGRVKNEQQEDNAVSARNAT